MQEAAERARQKAEAERERLANRTPFEVAMDERVLLYTEVRVPAKGSLDHGLVSRYLFHGWALSIFTFGA